METKNDEVLAFEYCKKTVIEKLLLNCDNKSIQMNEAFGMSKEKMLNLTGFLNDVIVNTEKFPTKLSVEIEILNNTKTLYEYLIVQFTYGELKVRMDQQRKQMDALNILGKLFNI